MADISLLINDIDPKRILLQKRKRNSRNSEIFRLNKSKILNSQKEINISLF
nr:MAG TPA: hypothetical protein [Caudoviricetes sp.]